MAEEQKTKSFPTSKSGNFEEVEKYTKYETARILGARALQISMGAPFLVKLNEEDLERIKYNPIEIAKMEFKEGIVPITVRRPYPVSENYKKAKEKAKEKQAS